MSSPFLGEIRSVPFNFAPQGWAFCDGQLLGISSHTALFSLIGTFYGGDGQTNFALPDMRERVPIGFGPGAGLTPRHLAEIGGAATVILGANEAGHSHALTAVSDPATASDPAGQNLAQSSSRMGNTYHSATNLVAMNAGSVLPAGGDQPHENRSPYLAIHFIIALQGIFPSHN